MSESTHIEIDQIMLPPARIRRLRGLLEATVDRIGPLVDLHRPYVDGLENLPADGRFLLVGNHTQSGPETYLIPYVVRRAIGTLVRPLADRRIAQMGGPAGDMLAACGAVVGAPETARELMTHNQTILVFPGGGPEIAKFKGEEYKLRWQERDGFARLSVENSYPIVPAALVGGDDVYRSLNSRDGAWGRISQAVGEKMSGRSDMAMPLMRGIGPTLIPRPQRMYLRFAAPIDTVKPARVAEDRWVATVRQRTKDSLEQALAGLLEVRADDPYRELNPLAWRDATQPPVPPHRGDLLRGCWA